MSSVCPTREDQGIWERLPTWRNGYQASTWLTMHFICDKLRKSHLLRNVRWYISPFQGRSRASSPNFRPRFESPGFPPPRHNVYPSQRQPFAPAPAQRPFMNNPGPQGGKTRSPATSLAGSSTITRLSTYPKQQRSHRVCTSYNLDPEESLENFNTENVC